LVSTQPGTQRDVAGGPLLRGGRGVRVVDAAGFDPAAGTVERLGMEKTEERVRDADVILWLIDGTTANVPPLPQSVAEVLGLVPSLLIINKIDLAPGSLAAEDWIRTEPIAAGLRKIRISAVRGDGLAELIEAMGQIADSFQVDFGEETIAVNARHSESRGRVKQALSEALIKASSE